MQRRTRGQTAAGASRQEYFYQATALLRARHPGLFANIVTDEVTSPERAESDLREHIGQRTKLIQFQIGAALQDNTASLEAAVQQLARWMDDRAIVRVLGAGRARLAAAIPANRLAHGGARVYLQDSMVPMPHSLHGGGIIAASASGRTPSVISALVQARLKNRDIRILGIAAIEAADFARACDVFIGIPHASDHHRTHLSALADIEEYTISELLDALVVAAGRRLGYTDATWRLGHEDLGPATGPYDFLLDS